MPAAASRTVCLPRRAEPRGQAAPRSPASCPWPSPPRRSRDPHPVRARRRTRAEATLAGEPDRHPRGAPWRQLAAHLRGEAAIPPRSPPGSPRRRSRSACRTSGWTSWGRSMSSAPWRSRPPARHNVLLDRPARLRQEHAGPPPALHPAGYDPRRRHLEVVARSTPFMGLLTPGPAPLVRPPPLPVSPHHTISGAGPAGGGSNPRARVRSPWPTAGVLFLDELPEFRQRHPRAHAPAAWRTAPSPSPAPPAPRPTRAAFMLVCAMNPCQLRLVRRPLRAVHLLPGARWTGHISRASPARCSTASTSSRRCRRSTMTTCGGATEPEPSAGSQGRASTAARAVQREALQGHVLPFSATPGCSRRPSSAASASLAEDGRSASCRQAFDSLGLTARSYDRILPRGPHHRGPGRQRKAIQPGAPGRGHPVPVLPHLKKD